MKEPVHIDPISLGEYRTLTFTFKQGGVLTDPSASPVLNMTPQGGAMASYTSQLIHAGTGTYTFGFSATTPGFWTGNIYAPPGAGQTAQPFVIEVLDWGNYP